MVSNILEGVCAVYSVKLSFADCRLARSAARYWRAVIVLHALWLKQEADIKGDCMESNSPPHIISFNRQETCAVHPVNKAIYFR